jgi:hypothetical protein
MKMKHISVFRLKPEYRSDGTAERVRERLLALPGKLDTIIGCEVGVKPAAMPDESPDGHVQFYDIVQIITFASQADCDAYPQSKAHRDFLDWSEKFMESVVAIDYTV